MVCIVLGRGADEAKVLHWLEVAASVEGVDGFAVGRTIWYDALQKFLADCLPGGCSSADRREVCGDVRHLPCRHLSGRSRTLSRPDPGRPPGNHKGVHKSHACPRFACGSADAKRTPVTA